MNVNPPTLRQKKDGRFFCRWGGDDHYFGRDRGEANKLFAASLQQWSAWSAAKRQAVKAITPSRMLVIDLAERFFSSKQLDGGKDLERYYRKHLKRFIDGFGAFPAGEIRAGHLQAIKQEMQAGKFSPKTVNHDLIAAKAMLQWGMDLELIQPVNLHGVKTIKLGPVKKKALTVMQVRAFVSGAPEHVRPWLAFAYLTAARPIEVVRIINGECEWVEIPWLVQVKSKMDRRRPEPRHVVVSDLALAWLAYCRPYWSRLDSFSNAVRAACGPGGPHPLRHSAATHLNEAGAAREDVDLILGHLPSRVSLTYAPAFYRPLREKIALLGL